jgi:hypothetical protein
MDGVSGLNQKSISPGKTFKYEYPLVQYGTYMYHSQFDGMTQMALGVMGVFVVHPRRPPEPPPDRDFAIMLSEWNIKPGTYRPDPRATEFNTFTFNAKVFPATEPLVARRGDRVRIRFVNLSAADHHTIHLHGHSFSEAQTDGVIIPPGARWPGATVLVPVGQSRTIDFVADNPGDWALHCQMTHHLKNQMGHKGPNMLGADAAMLKRVIAPLIPEYMPMGTTGGSDMTGMQTGSGRGGDKQAAKDKLNDHSKNTDTGDTSSGSGGMGMPENCIAMKGGEGPHGTIDMGGMLTILKVREHLTSYADPGWYQAPPGTVAQAASKQELERDGIEA